MKIEQVVVLLTPGQDR